MQAFTKIVKLFGSDFFNGVKLFFYSVNSRGICLFHLFRKPESLDHVKDYYSGLDYEEQRDSDLLEIADHRRDRAAEKIPGA